MDKSTKAFAVVLAIAFVMSFAFVNVYANDDDVSADSTAVVIDHSETYHSGEKFDLDKDYILNPGVVLTFEAGSYLVIDALKDISIKGNLASGFDFKEGAIVKVVYTDYSETNYVDEDTTVSINGKLTYDIALDITKSPMTVDASFTIDDGTIVVVNEVAYNFKETVMTLDGTVNVVRDDAGSQSVESADIDFTLKSKGIKASNEDFVIGEVTKIDIDFDVSADLKDGKDKKTVTVKGDCIISAISQGVAIDISEKADLTVGIQGLKDIDVSNIASLADVIPYLDGSLDGSIEVSADVENIKINDAKYTYKATCSNDAIKITDELKIGSIAVNFGEESGIIKNIVEKGAFDLELGSFLNLFSMRNFLAIQTFILSYQPSMAAPALEEYYVGYLAPICPDGFNVQMLVKSMIAQIPEESLPQIAMGPAFVLFMFGLEEKDYTSECQKAYDSIEKVGPVSDVLAYSEAYGKLVSAVMTGIDDPKPMTLAASCEFSVGEVSATSAKGYSMLFEGMSVQASIDSNKITAGFDVGAITAKATNDTLQCEIDIPAYGADIVISEDLISLDANLEGDFGVTYNGRYEGGLISIVSKMNGIDADYSFDLTDKGYTVKESTVISSMDFEYNSYVVKVGKITEKDEIEYTYGNLSDIFSLRNLDYIVDFLMNYNDPTLYRAATIEVAMDIYYTAFPTSEVEQEIRQFVADIPDEYMTEVGICSEYILYVFQKDGLNLKDECEKIKKGKDMETAEGIIDYVEEVSSLLFRELSGIKEVEFPELTSKYSFDLGEIDATIEGETLKFYGISYSENIAKGDISAKATFKGLDFKYEDESMAAVVILPKVIAEASIKDETITASYEIDGDLEFTYDDKDNEINSYSIALTGIDVTDEVSLKDGKLTLKGTESINEVFAWFDDGDSYTAAEFAVYGAESKVSMTLDLKTLINSLIKDGVPNIVTDGEYKVSVDGVFYNQVMPEIGKHKSMKAAIDGLSIDMKASTEGNNYTISGTCAVDGAYYTDANVSYSLKKISSKVDIKDGQGSAEVKGNANVFLFENGQEVTKAKFSNIDVKCDVIPADIDALYPGFEVKPTSVSVQIAVTNEGITTDLGTVTMSGDFGADDLQFVSDKTTIYGNYTGLGALDTAKGEIQGLVIIPSNDDVTAIKFDVATITFVDKNGAKMEATVTPQDKDKVMLYDFVMSGENVMYNPEHSIEGMLFYSILTGGYYYDFAKKTTITGDVPLIWQEIDLDEDVSGKVYTEVGIVYNDDEEIAVSFEGALLCVDYDKVGGTPFSIIPAPGYKLSGVYNGFEVDANGNVTINEDIISTESIGLEYTLTIDGVATKVQYGSVFEKTYTGPNEPLWYVDNDGRAHGKVVNGTFTMTYRHLGDLELKSVFGTRVGAPDGGNLAKVDDVAFFTESNGVPFAVENKVGVRFLIYDLPGQIYKYSAVEDGKIDGNKAYQIHGNDACRIFIPIDSVDASVYHVVNGTPLLMATQIFYDADTDQVFASVEVSGYSTFYVEEFNHGEGGSDNTMMYIIIAVVIIVVIAIIAVVLSKKKQTA